MIDRRRIIIMSKLALYDKKYGKKDMEVNKYFRHDYIYVKNFWTRLAAGIGTFIVILFIWLHKIIVGGVDISTLDFRQELIRIGIVFVVVLTVYTIIGTVKETIAYNKSTKRLNKYTGLLNQLEQANKRAEKELKEAALLYGADSLYPRRHN